MDQSIPKRKPSVGRISYVYSLNRQPDRTKILQKPCLISKQADYQNELVLNNSSLHNHEDHTVSKLQNHCNASRTAEIFKQTIRNESHDLADKQNNARKLDDDSQQYRWQENQLMTEQNYKTMQNHQQYLGNEDWQSRPQTFYHNRQNVILCSPKKVKSTIRSHGSNLKQNIDQSSYMNDCNSLKASASQPTNGWFLAWGMRLSILSKQQQILKEQLKTLVIHKPELEAKITMTSENIDAIRRLRQEEYGLRIQVVTENNKLTRTCQAIESMLQKMKEVSLSLNCQKTSNREQKEAQKSLSMQTLDVISGQSQRTQLKDDILRTEVSLCTDIPSPLTLSVHQTPIPLLQTRDYDGNRSPNTSSRPITSFLCDGSNYKQRHTSHSGHIASPQIEFRTKCDSGILSHENVNSDDISNLIRETTDLFGQIKRHRQIRGWNYTEQENKASDGIKQRYFDSNNKIEWCSSPNKDLIHKTPIKGSEEQVLIKSTNETWSNNTNISQKISAMMDSSLILTEEQRKRPEARDEAKGSSND